VPQVDEGDEATTPDQQGPAVPLEVEQPSSVPNEQTPNVPQVDEPSALAQNPKTGLPDLPLLPRDKQPRLVQRIIDDDIPSSQGETAEDLAQDNSSEWEDVMNSAESAPAAPVSRSRSRTHRRHTRDIVRIAGRRATAGR